MKLMPILEELFKEAGLDTGTKTLGGSHLDRDQNLFSITDVQEFMDTLKSQIDVPFISVSKSTLGGDRNVSVIISMSLDPKTEWPNGYYQNSRSMQFIVETDGVVEQFTKDPRIKDKFRKIRVKSAKDLIDKINKYLDKVK